MTLDEILKNEVEEVLRSPLLLTQMLFFYSKLYLNGGSPKTCEKTHRQYYYKLKNGGLQKLNKMKENKYVLKKGTVLHYKGQIITEYNITDSIAMKMLDAFPQLATNFDVIPKPEIKKPEPVNEVKKPAAKKKK